MVWKEWEEIINDGVNGRSKKRGKKRKAPFGGNGRQAAFGAGQADRAEHRRGRHAGHRDSAFVPDARVATYRASALRVRTRLVHRRSGAEASGVGGRSLFLRAGTMSG